VDNIILKIMEDGFIDGQGNRYNPSIIRVGTGQSSAVKAVSLESKVEAILEDHQDVGRLDASINGYKYELQRISNDIADLRVKLQLIKNACDWPLAKEWEIRVDNGTIDTPQRVFFVNHRDKTTTVEVPPPPEPGEDHFPATSMPEYRAYTARIVKLVENFLSVKSNMERCTIVQSGQRGANHMDVKINLEAHVLNSVHIVLTTLGSAGSRALEGIEKFEVIVVDEAAQSVEPATLSALQLGSRHCVLVGDPQQLPATIFNVSGRNTKYDRSLFQRLEEAGQPVYMLNEQYRYLSYHIEPICIIPKHDKRRGLITYMSFSLSAECIPKSRIFLGIFFTAAISWTAPMYAVPSTAPHY
jgi:senataxin